MTDDSGAARGRVRNATGWRDLLARLRGSRVRLDLSGFDADLDAIERYERDVRALSDAALLARATALRAGRAGRSRAAVRAELFALARDAARRALGQRPYDVQIVAALALDRGAVVEMQTGEGKTLTATMPVALQALEGRGAHVLTFNDYLARRDAEWMGPVYRLLGLSVGAVQQGMDAETRRRAYAADVTYVTAKEAGFDHLRDQLVERAADIVHRPRAFALVDEADSLLIDEARVPLVIAGRGARAPPARARAWRRSWRRSCPACTTPPTSTGATSSSPTPASNASKARSGAAACTTAAATAC